MENGEGSEAGGAMGTAADAADGTTTRTSCKPAARQGEGGRGDAGRACLGPCAALLYFLQGFGRVRARRFGEGLMGGVYDGRMYVPRTTLIVPHA